MYVIEKVPLFDPLTHYMSEFIHKMPVFDEEIEQISILQEFQEKHSSKIST